ncbi:LLM class flavin-dependent oxidoreductase [Curtobacterium sp. MCPF17_001]|uniref:LLM class flavin-dependent oxidoreductase n=1 Tax=Curtobacterium sp. MCPF17_001 TaxID=2175651 RepID=UPI000DAAB6A6|nr:LLM class flavin-dependent oxidoreductase [Curtobacterium sp. MCPF17_001]PZE60488.1 LLM class flavin-dependent oxidoreductase [Curtobacterium sp. MCPF17_001]
MSRVPLSVLDLVPVSAGSNASEALHNTVDLAREAEAAGYARYWLAEHHLNPGVAGSAPNLVMGAVAAATSSIRVGSAATLVGNVRALQIVEAFGTLVGLHGPRFDLGLGRSGAPAPGTGVRPPAPATAAARSDEVVDGLVVPAPFPFRVAPGSRFALQGELLGRVPGDVDRFADELTTIRAFLAGTFERDGVVVEATPASRPDSAPELWIHGSTGGESARIAGSLGLPYGANYHSSPGTVLDSVRAYREAFRPGVLDAPHVVVSADVVVADTDTEATRLGRGYGAWVHSIRSGVGAIPYPSPEDAPELPDDLVVTVADRLATRFVGAPEHVVERLATLRRVIGADELLVTTITHAHDARVRSYRLLADAWGA